MIFPANVSKTVSSHVEQTHITPSLSLFICTGEGVGNFVRDRVGRSVGLLVGDTVGVLVGDGVGESVGHNVGVRVGV